VEDDRELVTTQPRQRVGLPHLLPQPLRYLLQQGIPSWMAQRVIHLLEVVEVQAQHRDHLL